MERLRYLRKLHALSMKELGSLLGLAESTISLYEKGKRQPDNETLVKIAEYFNVSVDYLLGRENEKTPPAAELTEDERELLNNFRALNPTMRKYALEIIKAALSTQEQAAIDSIEQKKKYV